MLSHANLRFRFFSRSADDLRFLFFTLGLLSRTGRKRLGVCVTDKLVGLTIGFLTALKGRGYVIASSSLESDVSDDEEEVRSKEDRVTFKRLSFSPRLDSVSRDLLNFGAGTLNSGDLADTFPGDLYTGTYSGIRFPLEREQLPSVY